MQVFFLGFTDAAGTCCRSGGWRGKLQSRSLCSHCSLCQTAAPVGKVNSPAYPLGGYLDRCLYAG